MNKYLIFFILIFTPLVTRARNVYVTKSGHSIINKYCYYLKCSIKKFELSTAIKLNYKSSLVSSNFISLTKHVKKINTSGYNDFLYELKIQIFAIVVFLIFCLIIIRRNIFKKISNYIIKDQYFSELELKVIYILVFKEEKLDTNRFNTILNLDAKSLDAQRKSRLRFLNNLNKKLSLELNIPNVIERTTAYEDKRMIYYIISNKSKEQIKLLFGNFLIA